MDDILAKLKADPELTIEQKIAVLDEQISRWNAAMDGRAMSRHQVFELQSHIGQLRQIEQARDEYIQSLTTATVVNKSED